MDSQPTLFELLQTEFCPLLDASLLAALLAEIELDGDGNQLSPSPRQIQDLRSTLKELAAQADESQLCEGFSDPGRPSTLPTEETSSTTDFSGGDASNTSSTSLDSSGPCKYPFSSPLGFLQAALPHIPTATLERALPDAACDGGDVDMWEIVAGILTAESVRELEERGLDGLDEGVNDSENAIGSSGASWETVETKRKPRQPKAGQKKNSRGTKLTLVDIRQRQHSNTNYQRASPAPDPWTQLSSLSEYIATLLPPHPGTFFQSFFHSPEHETPYNALCSALASICETKSTSDEHNPVLFTLLDILLPSYESLDSEQRSRLISDAQLSLSATTCGYSDSALDLVHLLRELDSDSASGYLEMGVYHRSSQPAVTRTKLPVGPPSIPPPLPFKPRSKSPSSSPAGRKASPFQWQVVPRRKPPNYAPHPLAQHIPAYVRDVNGIKVKGSGNGFGKGGKGDVGELSEYRRRMNESMRKRDELLREATKMWQKGNAKTRGGEIAFYYASKARQFQELAKTEALNAARTMVESRRMTSHGHDTLDLHGTTVAEAIAIVQETLQSRGSIPNKPLKIITGRGTHSVNRTAVLKPAIKKALLDEGWSVGSWDAGLVVHGRRGLVA